jgi:long-chain acyl-CoA synthetase
MKRDSKRDFTHFADLYQYLAQTSPKDNFLYDLVEGKWQGLSKQSFLKNIRYLTLAFFDNNFSRSQIGIAISPSSYWLMLDYACFLSSSVSVPLFTNISSKNLLFELADASIHTVFIENEEQEKCIHMADKNIEVIYVGQGRMGSRESKKSDYRTFDTMLEEGKAIDKDNPTLFDELIGRICAEDIATIVYTSGTLGNPKGVELTHANLVSQINATAENYSFEKDSDVAFSFLPLAHIFERMVMHFYLSRELRVYFTDDVQNVAIHLKEVNPTVMTVVPRLLEKVYFKMRIKAMEGNPLKQALVSLAFYRATTKDPNSRITMIDRFLDKMVYAKLRLAFGSRMRMMISGGAALS